MSDMTPLSKYAEYLNIGEIFNEKDREFSMQQSN